MNSKAIMQYIEKSENQVESLEKENEQLRDMKWNFELKVEELEFKIQDLEQEKADIIQDRDDNWRPISVAEQIGMSERDFVWF